MPPIENAEFERILKDALDLPKNTSYEVTRFALDQRLVDNAIADGRIEASKRAEWLNRLAGHDLNDPAARDVARAERAAFFDLPKRPKPAAATTTPAAAPGPKLPAMIASGLDPALVLQVPEPVRSVLAAAATATEVHRLIEEYGGITTEDVVPHAMGCSDGAVVDAYKAWEAGVIEAARQRR